MECYLSTGEFDYLLRVVVSDMADFERIHHSALTRLPGVARVNSSVAIRTERKRLRYLCPSMHNAAELILNAFLVGLDHAAVQFAATPMYRYIRTNLGNGFASNL